MGLADEARAVLLAEALGSLHEVQKATDALRAEVQDLHQTVHALPLQDWGRALESHIEAIRSLDFHQMGSRAAAGLLPSMVDRLESVARNLVASEARRLHRRIELIALLIAFALGFLLSSVIHLWR